jgi:threonine dehydratase
MIDLQRILDAQSLLARHFGPTRIARAASLSSPTRNVFLKIETELPTGSFKVRGALYSLSVNLAGRDGLQAVPRITEVVCASTGNHGAAVAWAAQLLSVPATIFVPVNPNQTKADRIRALGARLVETGNDLSAAIDAAHDYAERARAFFLHDASDPHVPAGAGTIGVEIVDQLPELDVLYVPMGDTALIRGVASAVKQRRPSIHIVGVVAERAPAYLLSWRKARTAEDSRLRGASAGQARPGADDVVETATCDTIADGLAIRRPLAPNVEMIREIVDEVIAVSEQEMMAAMERLYTQEQLIAEPAGAAAVAAVLKQSTAAGNIVALVTGGNIAPDLRRKVLGGNNRASTTPADVA